MGKEPDEGALLEVESNLAVADAPAADEATLAPTMTGWILGKWQLGARPSILREAAELTSAKMGELAARAIVD
eukprot:1389849-Prymnesium_polylepis.1